MSTKNNYAMQFLNEIKIINIVTENSIDKAIKSREIFYTERNVLYCYYVL